MPVPAILPVDRLAHTGSNRDHYYCINVFVTRLLYSGARRAGGGHVPPGAPVLDTPSFLSTERTWKMRCAALPREEAEAPTPGAPPLVPPRSFGDLACLAPVKTLK